MIKKTTAHFGVLFFYERSDALFFCSIGCVGCILFIVRS